jgi:DNA-binding response OmpR family regulator
VAPKIRLVSVRLRRRLLSEVWGYNYYGTTRTLDQVIVQLRKKLGDNGEHPKHLLTVHGVGYKLAAGEAGQNASSRV